MTMMFLLLCSNQISPHHLDDDELLPHNNSKVLVDDAMSFYSVPSSFADSASTVISFKGKSMETNCPPQQLILFLVNELKTKVKLSHGVECELLGFFREVSIRFNFSPPLTDNNDISKHFKQLNYAIKRAFAEQAVKNSNNDGVNTQNQSNHVNCSRINWFFFLLSFSFHP